MDGDIKSPFHAHENMSTLDQDRKQAERAILPAPGSQGIDGITLYTRLAMSLRHRIASGEWALGDRLPSVDQLAMELGFGKGTVRQAFAQLVAEGLITSQRGRGTHVCRLPMSHSPGLRSAINDMVVDSAHLKIKILEKSCNTILPEMQGRRGEPFQNYQRLLKLHIHDGLPFCVMEMFVASDVYRRFPKGAEKRQKIAQLIHDAQDGNVGVLHQSITVEPASDTVARQLDYSLAAPVARVCRTTLDKQGRILTTGIFWYRGDRFMLETEVPAELTRLYPSISIPAAR